MKTLSAHNLCKRFGPNEALKNLSAELQSGTITGIIGPNGSGKSTLLGILSGSLRADFGRVLADGHEIGKYRSFERARLGVCRTFQDARNLPDFPAKELTRIATLRLGSAPLSGDGAPKLSGATNASYISSLGIANIMSRSASKLSFGEQKLAILSAILDAERASCLLLDEPVSGIKQVSRNQNWSNT